MGRKIAALSVGLLVAFAMIFVIEMGAHYAYPAPANLDFSQPGVVASYMKTLPLGAFAFVLGGFVLGTLSGGFTAAKIARDRPYLYAGIIGALILAATIANMVMIPHPIWFVVLSLVLIVAATVLAGKLAQR